MSVFITKNTMVAKLANTHAAAMGKAVEDINLCINRAKAWPIRFPASLLTDIADVRAELLRRLEQEAGYRVSFEEDGVVVVLGK